MTHPLVPHKRTVDKRIDDFTGLSQLELLYTGVLRTPIFAITKEKVVSITPVSIDATARVSLLDFEEKMSLLE